MPNTGFVTVNFEIKVDGRPIDAAKHDKLLSLQVDSGVNLPDQVVLVFHDQERDLASSFGLGKELEISGSLDGTNRATLTKVEITALEAHAGTEPESTLVVRGFDKLHRLTRGTRTRTFLDKTYSDIVRSIAGERGLSVSVEATSETHKHVFQVNSTDFDFLSALAREVGYELAYLDGQLKFRKPPTSGTEITLEAKTLRTCGIGLTASEQVDEAEVRSWDWVKKAATVGKTRLRRQAPVASPVQSSTLAAGSKTTVVTLPCATQAGATKAAEAMATSIAAAALDIEGRADGNPALKAGTFVKVTGMGSTFNGKYYVSAARHTWAPHGEYETQFLAAGPRNPSVYGLVSGGNGTSGIVASPGNAAAMPAVMPAIVTNINDPDKNHRVKVKFPWLDDTQESDWARVVQVGAGKDRGWAVLPEVDDEVLVAFEHGDPRRPYVLGGLYNGKDKPKPGAAELVKGGKVEQRAFTTRAGHQLLLVDEAGKEKIELSTSKGAVVITLDEANKTLKIVSTGGKVEVEADQDITVNTKANLKLTAATGNVEIEGMTVKIKAKTQLNLEGTAQAALKAPMVQLG